MKKIISLLISALIIVSAVASCVISAGAVTYVTYGDYDLAVKDESTYLIGGYNGSESVLTFPDSANGKAIVGVAEDFCENCSAQIVSITMPDSFTTVESFAFSEMTSIEEVVLSTNLSSIGAMAFSGCSSLESINLADTKVKNVSYACFSGCSALESVSIPEGLSGIGNYAFSKSGLISVDLPYSVRTVGNYAFSECSALEEVSLPYGLTSIGEYAFYNDSGLVSVFVPGSVSQIGAFAFSPMGIEGGTLTLECFKGTYAASYAYDNYLNVSAAEKLTGDVDGNGKVNIDDVTYIQLYRVGLHNISGNRALEISDVNGDGEVTLRDATTIQMFLANMITEF